MEQMGEDLAVEDLVVVDSAAAKEADSAAAKEAEMEEAEGADSAEAEVVDSAEAGNRACCI